LQTPRSSGQKPVLLGNPCYRLTPQPRPTAPRARRAFFRERIRSSPLLRKSRRARSRPLRGHNRLSRIDQHISACASLPNSPWRLLLVHFCPSPVAVRHGVSIGSQSAPRIGGQKETQRASILPSRPIYSMSRRAERRSRTAAFQRPPAGLVLDDREHDGRMVGLRGGIARRQARCLNRQLSLPVSTISQWWVRRSRRAVVILASPKTLGHSAKARLVVTMMDVRS
jgi:hypothetical protein